MSPDLIVVLLFGASVLIAVMGLTTIGARRRGRGLMVALLAGLLFPIAWVVWYLRDERPYRRQARTPRSDRSAFGRQPRT